MIQNFPPASSEIYMNFADFCGIRVERFNINVKTLKHNLGNVMS